MFTPVKSLLLLASSAFALPAFTPDTFSGPIPEKRGHFSKEYNASVPRWEWWPDLGALPGNPAGAYLNQSNGVDVWYAEMGCEHKGKGKGKNANTPVLLLHGGEGNSNQMYLQARALVKDHCVISMDTRGEGRSPFAGFTKLHYDDIARDAIAVLDHLKVPKVAVVGWSDGAITGLNLAMNYTSRIDRVFAHGANAQWNMTLPEYSTFTQLRKRDDDADDYDPYSYANLSPTPDKEAESNAAVETMWNTEPTWGPDAFALIEAPVWIVDGDRDTSITRNQPDAMASWTPFAGQLILPQVGHDALAEDPKFFNFAMRYFLEMEFDGQLPVY